MNEEGVIKYKGTWLKKDLPAGNWFEELDEARDRMFRKKLIGCNADGIGYGNISMRFHQNQFIISGSGTGVMEELKPEHYTLVTNFDFDQNALTAEGPVMASSESLTHAMIYLTRPDVNAVIHVHHIELWKKLLKTHPSTSELVPYGTPEMAREIHRLLSTSEHGLFAMGGHEEGIISCGRSLVEAEALLNTQLSLL